MDSVGIGELDDASAYGDQGSNTLGNIARRVSLKLPTLRRLGIEKLVVTIRMMDGGELEGRIKNFDRFALILDHGGTDHLVFKHAIATIKTPKAVSNYFSHQ